MGYYWRELCRPFLLSLYFSCFLEAVAITDIAGGGNRVTPLLAVKRWPRAILQPGAVPALAC